MRIIFMILIMVGCSQSLVMAYDGGNKEKKQKDKGQEVRTGAVIVEEDLLKHGMDISNNSVDENEEIMASWYIYQSLPKTEKISKIEEKMQKKLTMKIIRQERKECKKLQRSLKKDQKNTAEN